MKLLYTENTSYNNVITESFVENGNLYLEGPFLMGEVKNRNGRIYTKDVLDSMVENYRREYIDTDSSLGEINHPEYPMPNIAEAAIKTLSLTPNGNNYDGKAIILNSVYGQTIKALNEVNFPLGVSSRAIGNVTVRNGISYPNMGTVMNAIDVVNKPSGQICYPAMINESVDWVMKDGEWIIEESESVHEPIKLNNLLDQLIHSINKGK